MDCTVRPYLPTDETAWLRCRALAFLDTAYFDDVKRVRPAIAAPGFALVAVGPDGAVIGVIDVEVEHGAATVETVAVHPDHRSRGVGGALLEEALDRLAALGATTLDAWTRDDPDTLRWYRSNGFAEGDHYLHVYADYYTDAAEPDRAIGGRRPGLRPVKALLHAAMAEEAAMREQFARVHVCRRFVRSVKG
ncbi:GNAT family N-acetyltransferase [Glycomyces sp. A-F 0318]|uniref:GNAT family N-acetyltransferase n=1 Tax=Glycomyces amatae TaxID=2881355 RepID=UPI001E479E0D|nr:GNAT family N-acetyltransferase [Glycomyces amatae]MCD0444053.1 GNAT family N-acetyltransferase [Glycomyces amatae]